MKKSNQIPAVIKILIVWTVYCLFLAGFTSCSTYKKQFEEAITKTEKSEYQKSLERQKELVEKSKAIVDNFKLAIPKYDSGDQNIDDKVNKGIDQILQKLNTSKSSGDNSYNLGYNAAKRELEAEFKIAPTEDRSKTQIKSDSLSSSEKNDRSLFQETKTKIKVIPLWVWIVLLFVFHRPILMLLSLLFPFIKSIPFLQKIIKPKST